MPQFPAVSFLDKAKEKYRIIWSKWEGAGQFEGEFRSTKPFLSKTAIIPTPYLEPVILAPLFPDIII